MLAGEVAHQTDGGAVGDRLGEVVPPGGLLGAEVGAVENLLQADDLRAGRRRLTDVLDVLVDHGLLGGFERGVGRGGVGSLNERAPHVTGHEILLGAREHNTSAVWRPEKEAMTPIMEL